MKTIVLFFISFVFISHGQTIRNLMYKNHETGSYRMIKEGKNLKLQCSNSDEIFKGKYTFTDDHHSIVLKSDTILISSIEKLWIRTPERVGTGTTLMLLYGGAMGFAGVKGPGEAILVCFIGSPLLCAGMSLVIFRKRFDIDEQHSLSYHAYQE